jgi:hypothetical protein
VTLRKELEAAERRRARVYEIALAAAAAVVGSALLAGIGAAIYALTLGA